MNVELKWLARQQMSSGQFPTTVLYKPTGLVRNVSTICPTYLIVFILTLLRERKGSSDPVLDRMVKQGLDFLEERMYVDPVEGFRAWHFNAFYPPDWEETCWCSLLLANAGRMGRDELDPLRRLLDENTTDMGIGVWLKDPYTPNNGAANTFDPIVAMSIQYWLRRLYDDHIESVDDFVASALKKKMASLYYDRQFQEFFYWIMGLRCDAPSLDRDDHIVFHNARRKRLNYASEEVWRAAELLMST